jgi:hypothetical protein
MTRLALLRCAHRRGALRQARSRGETGDGQVVAVDSHGQRDS